MAVLFKSFQIGYQKTGYFTKIVTDYLSQNIFLTKFYEHPVTIEGIKDAVAAEKCGNTARQLLAKELQKQYATVQTSERVSKNIEALQNENTFTVCTAHQPNIFTGHLYFIYKIMHAIKLADVLNEQLPDYNFVPVFYMGTEDADIEELGHIFLKGEKYEWNTRQTGAVGRMEVDEVLLKLLDKIEGRFSVDPFGKEIIELLKSCYKKGTTIQHATFNLVNSLFADYGLIVLLPDNAGLKSTMMEIFKDDLFNHTSSEIVSSTSEKLSAQYKVQAHPREINLFYLENGIRSRITFQNSTYRIQNSNLEFSKAELENELQVHPERFSPNVILRGIYQEKILPNIAFIGGGGELAYWLQLKDLFHHYKVHFPVLVVRNSFVLIEKRVSDLFKKLRIDLKEIFKGEDEIVKQLIKKNSRHKLSLEDEKQQIISVYEHAKSSAKEIDKSLLLHIENLKIKNLKSLEKLEKKLLKAEKKNFESGQRQVKKIKESLFPLNSLQERVDNFIPYYAKWGKEFLQVLYETSLPLEQKFTVITEE